MATKRSFSRGNGGKQTARAAPEAIPGPKIRKNAPEKRNRNLARTKEPLRSGKGVKGTD